MSATQIETHGSVSTSLRPSEASARFREIESLNSAELEEVFLRGTTPDIEDLAGWVFRGTNTPGWAKLVGIKKFMKGFWRDEGGHTYGYNHPTAQNSLYDPWIAKPSDTDPKRFGFYSVKPVDPEATDNAHLHSILLDYSQGGNPPWDPSGRLRDYLVQVDAENGDLFLGKAYIAVGRSRMPVSFFVLERDRMGPAWRI